MNNKTTREPQREYIIWVRQTSRRSTVKTFLLGSSSASAHSQSRGRMRKRSEDSGLEWRNQNTRPVTMVHLINWVIDRDSFGINLALSLFILLLEVISCTVILHTRSVSVWVVAWNVPRFPFLRLWLDNYHESVEIGGNVFRPFSVIVVAHRCDEME